MQTFLLLLALFLLLNFVIGIWRVLLGPTAVERMLSAQLFSTTAVAILLLLTKASSNSSLLNVALIFALLAAITAVAFVRRVWPEEIHDYDTD